MQGPLGNYLHRPQQLANMIYLSAQPDTIYYAWQVEVMLENFISKGISQSDIHIVVGYKDRISEKFLALKNKYKEVNFGFERDNRPLTNYVSSIRPWILMRYFRNNWQLKHQTIFYHDCDILFTRKPNFNKFKKDDLWYQSDTNNYLDYRYVSKKGDDVLKALCDIGGMSKIDFKRKIGKCGGAQTIMKNVDWYFWQQVYIMSEKLFTDITKLNRIKVREDKSHHPLQIWCADMWALLFVAWNKGHETQVHKDLEFTWATCGVEKWHKNTIYHNAGVTINHKNLFMKQNFTNKLPYFVNIKVDPKKANSKYYEIVRKMRTKTCLK